MDIRLFRPADLPAVLALNQGAAPEVARVNARELQQLSEQATLTLVACTADRVAGYLLAFSAATSYSGEEFEWVKARFDRFLHIDQVAVAAGDRGRGIGSALYAALAPFCRDLACTSLTCGVNLEPPNPGSLQFHARQKFEEVGRLATRDGPYVALLRKRLTTASSPLSLLHPAGITPPPAESPGRSH